MIRCIPYSNTIGYYFYLCSQSIKGVAINFSSFKIASSIYSLTKFESSLGIQNYMVNSTSYGDWSWTTYNKDTKETIGEFCADSLKSGKFLCSLITSYIVKCMNYTINSGGTSITEGNPITILSGCGNGITIKEFDITDFLFNSDNDGIACYVNDKKIK